MVKTKAKVMLVDDHAMVRQSMTSLLNSTPNLQVVAEAGSAAETLEILATKIPIDIVLLDLTLKDVTDLDLIQQLSIQYPELPVLVVSMHNEKIYAERVLRSGARGYVMKQEPGEELLAAISEVLQGNVYLSQSMTSLFLNRNVKKKLDPEQLISQLTDSEIEILQMIASGLGSQEIATLTSRSVKTVETHRANIRAKLNLKNSADLIRFATIRFSQSK
jgi:DNA-binding NarL/FixJ family response regulator